MGLGSFITRHIVAWLCKERASARDFPLCDFERIRYELRPCDVLLVDGRTRVSDVIKLVTLSPWSHAALYIGRLHDIEDEQAQQRVAALVGPDCKEQLIIETELGLGAVVRPLSAYRNDHLRICRPRGLAMAECQNIVRYAVANLGKSYDVRQIFDLARFLLPWSVLPRRWRSTLFARAPGAETKTVCSTMIAEAFDAVEFPILPLVKRTESGVAHLYRRNPRLCTPSDFDYSPHFEIIKYPFWDLSSRDGYQLSPIGRRFGLQPAQDNSSLAPEEDGVFLPMASAPSPQSWTPIESAPVESAPIESAPIESALARVKVTAEPRERQAPPSGSDQDDVDGEWTPTSVPTSVAPSISTCEAAADDDVLATQYVGSDVRAAVRPEAMLDTDSDGHAHGHPPSGRQPLASANVTEAREAAGESSTKPHCKAKWSTAALAWTPTGGLWRWPFASVDSKS
jgi:hypothetical protein